MAQESVGVGQRAKSLVQQAKRSAGVGDPPLATEAGGRAEGMGEEDAKEREEKDDEEE